MRLGPGTCWPSSRPPRRSPTRAGRALAGMGVNAPSPSAPTLGHPLRAHGRIDERALEEVLVARSPSSGWCSGPAEERSLPERRGELREADDVTPDGVVARYDDRCVLNARAPMTRWVVARMARALRKQSEGAEWVRGIKRRLAVNGGSYLEPPEARAVFGALAS